MPVPFPQSPLRAPRLLHSSPTQTREDPMAQQQQPKNSAKDMTSWKPGSEPDKAKDVAAKGDFGVPATPSADRDYVSENTRHSDPGAALPFSFEHDGVRDHGAGARDSGPGSASAGDLDTDIIGV